MFPCYFCSFYSIGGVCNNCSHLLVNEKDIKKEVIEESSVDDLEGALTVSLEDTKETSMEESQVLPHFSSLFGFNNILVTQESLIVTIDVLDMEMEDQEENIGPYNGDMVDLDLIDPLAGVDPLVRVDPLTGVGIDPLAGVGIDPLAGVGIDPLAGVGIDPFAEVRTDPLAGVGIDPFAEVGIDPLERVDPLTEKEPTITSSLEEPMSHTEWNILLATVIGVDKSDFTHFMVRVYYNSPNPNLP